MARAAQAKTTAENPPVTAPKRKRPTRAKTKPTKPPVVGTPFPPGLSGNPGGRPKGLARHVRDQCGGNGELLVSMMLSAMSGRLPDGVEADGVTQKFKPVDVPDRLAAARWLGDRGWGKAPAYAPIEEGDPLDISEQAETEMAADLDRALDELAEKRRKRNAA